MFFVEYIEDDGKKAVNLAMCRSIETHKHETSSQSDFSLKIEFSSNARMPSVSIDFKTEEELDNAFESLMKAIQESETRHWKAPTFDDA
ncbi:MAG: hypothetical protein OXI43_02770 [Candidatus Poribacteria bacterium]|nr:hypothetical protein [Candidatus Poribacteria bacterium]